MKAGIILVIIIAIGFAVWKFKERKRVKNAEALKLHKATLRAAKPIKSNEDKALEVEMKRMQKAMNDADIIFKDYDTSKIKKLN